MPVLGHSNVRTDQWQGNPKTCEVTDFAAAEAGAALRRRVPVLGHSNVRTDQWQGHPKTCELMDVAAAEDGRAPKHCRVEVFQSFGQPDAMNGSRVLVLMALAALCGGCDKPAAPAPASRASAMDPLPMPTQAQPKLRTIKLWLGAEQMDAEMALSRQEQATGMMFRTNRLAEDSGMLFPMPVTQRVAFWMTNCPLPLDAAYIDPDGVIQEVHAFKANDPSVVYSRSDTIRFVLETADGWFQRHNISTGAVVRVESGSLMNVFFSRPGP